MREFDESTNRMELVAVEIQPAAEIQPTGDPVAEPVADPWQIQHSFLSRLRAVAQTAQTILQRPPPALPAEERREVIQRRASAGVSDRDSNRQEESFAEVSFTEVSVPVMPEPSSPAVTRQPSAAPPIGRQPSAARAAASDWFSSVVTRANRARETAVGQRVERFLTDLRERLPAADVPPPVHRVLSPPPTYHCQICLFNYSLREATRLPCGHNFCLECLQGYVTSKIGDGQVLRIRCPHVDDEQMGQPTNGWACAHCTFFNPGTADTAAATHVEALVECQICETRQPRPPPAEPGCTHEFDEAALTSTLQLDEATLTRYRRFVAMKSDSRYRECPKCNAPHTDGPARANNELTCVSCSHKFCFVHGDAHAGQSCQQYARRRRREEAATERTIDSTTRKCPNRECAMPITKAGGCNHMTVRARAILQPNPPQPWPLSLPVLISRAASAHAAARTFAGSACAPFPGLA